MHPFALANPLAKDKEMIKLLFGHPPEFTMRVYLKKALPRYREVLLKTRIINFLFYPAIPENH